jgi:hypothetical protein
VVSLAECHARDTAGDQACQMLIIESLSKQMGTVSRNEHVSMGSKQPKKSVFHGAAPAGRGSLKIAGLLTTSFTRLVQSETSSV